MSWGWSEFWAMGGYGLYVWGSYGAAVLIVAGEVLLVRARRRAALQQARRLRGEKV